MTGLSYHDLYVPVKYCGLLGFLKPRPPQPALPAQISPALKERLLQKLRGEREADCWHEINLSLSEKDYKRWKLAGAAYLKETKIQGVSVPGNGSYWHFEMAQFPLEPVLASRYRNLQFGSSGKTLVT